MVLKSSFGVRNDPELDDDVPGTVLLLANRNQPLGDTESTRSTGRKRTKDGKIILNPQPMENPNDPLNWPAWRRDAALVTLGWHCLIGGGQTPVLAAGFGDVANTFNVTVPQVALTTGLYMLGLGIGCVVLTPLAVMYGKRCVYLFGVILFLVTSVWAGQSQSYGSLLIARIFMGIGVSPCESLPSATIAEIYFLHERAYRLGIYTLLLLGGKNIVPLVSAVIIQSLSWRWVFNIVAIIVAFDLGLLFFFVPETFWNRTPRAARRPSILRRVSSSLSRRSHHSHPSHRSQSMNSEKPVNSNNAQNENHSESSEATPHRELTAPVENITSITPTKSSFRHKNHSGNNLGSPMSRAAHFSRDTEVEIPDLDIPATDQFRRDSSESVNEKDLPKRTFLQELRVFNGRLDPTPYWKILLRPLALFAYPAILWSSVVYALSVGWLIVMSESVAHIYQANPYNFSALSTGLIYLSPFIGGIIGTAVAGKMSDIIVRFMARRNRGIYEPEFRLVMAIPVALTTAIGLAGFGWSASIFDSWIVPTVFFGLISFGCSLGSTTAITYAVDCYRHFAGEALVTLNFSKNVFHGFVFSFFFNHWLDADGARLTFLALGIIHVGLLSFSIPLYIYGKRLRAWRSRSPGWIGRLR